MKFAVVILIAALASSAANAEPKTVVRIKSHGASGTVIYSWRGGSWILSCAHMFWGRDRRPSQQAMRGRILMDGPRQPHAPATRAHAKLVAVSFRDDLSLIYLPNGPFYAVPPAANLHRINIGLTSAGYDEMRWPITSRTATLVAQDVANYYTRERPWHGRSGGPLVDGGKLVGVVQGYEVSGRRRGIYVHHRVVLRFLTDVAHRNLHRIDRPQYAERPTPYTPDRQLKQQPRRIVPPAGGC